MITTQIEQAICLRLQRGLGRMVRTVKSYNGEADDLAAQIKTLPAVWVTYGGSRVETISGGNRLSRHRHVCRDVRHAQLAQ